MAANGRLRSPVPFVDNRYTKYRGQIYFAREAYHGVKSLVFRTSRFERLVVVSRRPQARFTPSSDL
jgi:hypothetical protein